MRPVLLAAVILAALPAAAADLPSIADARAQLERGEVDEVYLAFGALKKGRHPEGDANVAALLADAAKAALAKNDPSLAIGLADRARALDPRSVPACLAVADAALALSQRAAAEEALDAALKLAPRDFALVRRRAAFAEDEGQPELALKLLRSIPASDPAAAEARKKAAAIEAALKERDSALSEQKRHEADVARRQRDAAEGRVIDAPPEGGEADDDTRARTDPGETVAGMAARSSDHFRVVYFQGSRDFAQKAQYEQRVLDMFERAYHLVRQRLGRATSGRVDVVLYTREEFALHFGGQFGNGVLGFYAGKIRMNRSENLDEQWFATAVHEYVHAAVDAITAGRGDAIPVWMNEGLARWIERAATGGDFVNWSERAALRAGPIPSLAQLDGGFRSCDPAIAYATGSTAVESLVRGAGLDRLVRVIEASGRGAFAQAFAREYGERRLSALDGEIASLIGK